MQPLTPAGHRLVDQLAQRFGLSHDTIFCMLVAVNNGGGTMAQFNCPELGGSGQWMRGGGLGHHGHAQRRQQEHCGGDLAVKR